MLDRGQQCVLFQHNAICPLLTSGGGESNHGSFVRDRFQLAAELVGAARVVVVLVVVGGWSASTRLAGSVRIEPEV